MKRIVCFEDLPKPWQENILALFDKKISAFEIDGDICVHSTPRRYALTEVEQLEDVEFLAVLDAKKRGII